MSWTKISPEISIYPDETLIGVSSTACEFDNILLHVYIDEYMQGLRYQFLVNSQWTSPRDVTPFWKATYRVSPALISFRGTPFLYTGETDSRGQGRVVERHFDRANGRWSSPVEVPALTRSRPGLAIFNGELVMMICADNADGGLVFLRRTQSGGWQQITSPNEQSYSDPALCVAGGKLHCLMAEKGGHNNILILQWSNDSGTSGGRWDRIKRYDNEGAWYGIGATQFATGALAAFVTPIFLSTTPQVRILEFDPQTGWPSSASWAGDSIVSASPPYLSVHQNRVLCCGSVIDYETSRVFPKLSSPCLYLGPGPDLSTWMSHIPDSTRISEMSIPGTHDSATGALQAYVPFVSTQNIDIEQQFMAGVRAFDFRLCTNYFVDPFTDDSWLVSIGFSHGPIPLDGNGLRTGLSTLSSVLKRYPSEGIIVSLKLDLGRSTTEYEELFRKTIDGYSEFIASPQPGRFPTLSDIRGKILILRRSGVPKDARFVDISRLDTQGDNSPDFPIKSSIGTIRVEDLYKPDTLDEKWSSIKNMIAAVGDGAWIITFTSGYITGEFTPFGMSAESTDKSINYRLLDLVSHQPINRCIGTVLVDFADLPDGRLLWEIVRRNPSTSNVTSSH